MKIGFEVHILRVLIEFPMYQISELWSMSLIYLAIRIAYTHPHKQCILLLNIWSSYRLCQYFEIISHVIPNKLIIKLNWVAISDLKQSIKMFRLAKLFHLRGLQWSDGQIIHIFLWDTNSLAILIIIKWSISIDFLVKVIRV